MYGQGGAGLSTLPLVRFHRGLRGKMYSSLSFEHLFPYVSPHARCGAGKRPFSQSLSRIAYG